MTKDKIDGVEQSRGKRGTNSEANTPLETKQSLERVANPTWQTVAGRAERVSCVRVERCRDGRKRVQTIHRDYPEKVGDLAPFSLVDDAVSEERFNRTATLRSEPTSRRTDRQQPSSIASEPF
jgi:hypothetical protein